MGTPELIIAAVIILLLFGGSQLPKLAKNLGSAQKEFKKGLESAKDEVSSAKAPAADAPSADAEK